MANSANRVNARRYPPLILAGLGLYLTITVLPSALNLTTPNPSQTLEYAPVSPDDVTGPPGGSLSSLGLGSSGTLSRAGSDPSSAAGGLAGGGARPTTKRCVGNPPRQTEDPLAPPCVAFFSGNNGGATAPGVTADEVRVVLRQQGHPAYGCSSYVDLGQPHPPNQPTQVDESNLRLYQAYFNNRFQTYERRVRFFLAFSSCSQDAASARADAADNIAKVKPFAVLNFYRLNESAYNEAMADRGVLVLGQLSNMSEDIYRSYPGKIWGVNPTIEYQASLFSRAVCANVVPHPVTFSGNPTDNGRPRRLGLLSTEDPEVPELAILGRLVKSQVQDCGGNIVAEATTPGFRQVGQDPANGSQRASENMANFRTKDVTTIIWPGSAEQYTSHAANGIQYRPEIVLMGLAWTTHDGNFFSRSQEQSVWRNAWVVSNKTYFGPYQHELCVQAALEVDPQASTVRWSFMCNVSYPAFFQLFSGIQVAGSRLTTASLEQGFHAIPHIASENIRTPACFYNLGDYTCVKDATFEWWDPAGNDPNTFSTPNGCWRQASGGRRYLPQSWPTAEISSHKQANDRCNLW